MLRELAKKAEEIWDSHVIIYSMVLTPRQSSSYPKTHLQGHLALCPSGSAACINALTFVKAVRAEKLWSRAEDGGALLAGSPMSSAVIICREHSHTEPCWPGWMQSSARGFGTEQESLSSSVPFVKLGRCG